ncbi:MAG: PilN domain-containing protein [Candidatus Magasanikbacteria bacterium]|jgi:Tfp pilus assembly protein PilN
MHPLRLNLLSPQKKSYLTQMTHFQFIKNICEILLIIASLIGIALLGSQLILQTYFGNLMESIVQIDNQHTEEIRTIIQINKALDHTREIQKEFVVWTPKLEKITSAIPEGITIYSQSISYPDKMLTLTGLASTRDNLITFHENLKKIPFVQGVNTPLSELTQPENISFTITASLVNQDSL